MPAAGESRRSVAPVPDLDPGDPGDPGDLGDTGDDARSGSQVPAGRDREGSVLNSAANGRGRELSRRRTKRTALPDTGRRHHIGAAPSQLTALREDGVVVVTRTSPVQLADQTVAQLDRLAAHIESQMSAASAALEFEKAADHREEALAVRRELQRRAGTRSGAPPGEAPAG